MNKNSRLYASVDLDAIRFNLDSMKSNIDKETEIMAVVKTDGYGHGAEAIACEIESIDYLWGFAVATDEEAVLLRKHGIKKPILVLGYTFAESYENIVKYEIRPVVFKEDMARELSDEAVKQGKTVYFHLGVDTGMGRIGVFPDRSSIDLVKRISELPNVKMEGIFTHFSKADMTDKEPTDIQIRKFTEYIDILKDAGVSFEFRHCSNSAGIVEIRKANMDIARAGITLYGLWPSNEVRKNIELKPALALKSHIVYIKEVAAGTEIGYGGTWKAQRVSRIATLPVGYGDGYPRMLSNKGYVLIHGKKSPIVGRVCMDQVMTDVTDIPEAREYDEVTLIGRDGREEITMEMLGDLSGRFNY